MAYRASTGASLNNADGKIIIGTSVDMYGMNTGLNKIKNSIKQLSYFTGASLGIVGLVKFGKSALDAASDVKEVQNVVDVSFGEMSWAVDKFAETCIDKFGMSELAAKQTAGSFMAMGKALGITQENAANMSLNLTALSGDFASFYNISQDYARVALSAVYTGETETLKRYGIVLTEANLQEFASRKGIEEKVKSMDSATKTMLRYQYVMEATKDVAGDFVRTENSWANQTRILKERWKQLLITIGGGLSTVFAPVLAYLNKIVQYLIVFSRVLGDVIAKVFGIKFEQEEKNIKGIADNTSDAVNETDDLADSLDKASKKAKKLLAPYDELNNIRLDDTSNEDVKDYGLDDITDMLDALGRATDGVSDAIPVFDTFFDFGKWVGEQLKDLLDNIPWDDIQAEAKKIGESIGDLINGFISVPGLGYTIGKSIGEAINTGVALANGFFDKTQWAKLGVFIGEGINGIVDSVDWESIGHLVANYFNSIFATLGGVADTVDWYKFGERFGDGINKMISDMKWSEYGTTFIRLFTGIFESVDSAIMTINWSVLGDSISDGLNSAIGELKYTLYGQTIYDLLNSSVEFASSILDNTEFDKLGEKIGTNLSILFQNFDYKLLGHDVAQLLNDTFDFAFNMLENIGLSNFGTGLVDFINTAIQSIDGSKVGTTISEFVVQALDFAIGLIESIDFSELSATWMQIVLDIITNIDWSTILARLIELLESLRVSILSYSIGAGDKILEIISEVLENIANSIYEQAFEDGEFSIKGFLLGILSVLTGIADWITNNMAKPFIDGITKSFNIRDDGSSKLSDLFINMFIAIGKAIIVGIADVIISVGKELEELSNSFEEFSNGVVNAFEELKNNANEKWNTFWDKVDTITSEMIPSIISHFETFRDNIKEMFIEYLKEQFEEFKNDIVDKLRELFNGIREQIETLVEIKDKFDEFKMNCINTCEELHNSLNEIFNNIGSGIVNAWDEAWQDVKEIINSMLSGVEDFVNYSIDGINGFIDALNNLGEFELPNGDVVDFAPNIGYLSTISIPRLAKGAVLPPNAPFMAMLGDQRHGTNIETPLDTMIEAMVSALQQYGFNNNNNQDIVVQIDGREIARATRREDQVFRKSTGHSMFDY